MPASADHRSSNISLCWTTRARPARCCIRCPKSCCCCCARPSPARTISSRSPCGATNTSDFLRPFLPYQGGIPIERQKRSYLCSTRLDVDSFARIVRGHWGIENRLYWVPDVVFRDDLARLRSGQYGHHQHTANLLTQAKPAINFKN